MWDDDCLTTSKQEARTDNHDEKIVVSRIRPLTFRKKPGNSCHRQTATGKFGKHGNRGHLCTKQIIWF